MWVPAWLWFRFRGILSVLVMSLTSQSSTIRPPAMRTMLKSRHSTRFPVGGMRTILDEGLLVRPGGHLLGRESP
jgi:hypothetical protein